MDAPTARQLEVLDFMLGYQAEHGMPPTVREIATAFGFTSTNSVASHLLLLAKKGLVRHRPGVSRAWRALEQQPHEETTTP